MSEMQQHIVERAVGSNPCEVHQEIFVCVYHYSLLRLESRRLSSQLCVNTLFQYRFRNVSNDIIVKYVKYVKF